MTAHVQHQQAARKRLVKKPRNLAVPNAVPLIVSIATVTFTGKSTLISHSDLRSRTLQSHLGKMHKPSASWQPSITHQSHGVELTDDVVVRDQNGQRVPMPAYATLRIDQLPQFRKG